MSKRSKILGTFDGGKCIPGNSVSPLKRKLKIFYCFQVQERATFNDMIAKLHKKIAGNKKTIADITEMAILAFDQRDEAQSKITALQVRSAGQIKSFIGSL
jgi:hypothetical protein